MVFRPLSDANQANELHGYFSMEPQEVASADHSNQQYSITAVTTSAGAIAERYAYSAYGEPTICDASGSVIASSAINSRYSYTGREWDAAAGLYHFRARWMSPKTGRFLGRDPIGFEGSEWALYEYCASSPLRYVDPTGLACKDDFNACVRAAEADHRQCIRLCRRMCDGWLVFDLSLCSVAYAACEAAKRIPPPPRIPPTLPLIPIRIDPSFLLPMPGEPGHGIA